MYIVCRTQEVNFDLQEVSCWCTIMISISDLDPSPIPESSGFATESSCS